MLLSARSKLSPLTAVTLRTVHYFLCRPLIKCSLPILRLPVVIIASVGKYYRSTLAQRHLFYGLIDRTTVFLYVFVQRNGRVLSGRTIVLHQWPPVNAIVAFSGCPFLASSAQD